MEVMTIAVVGLESDKVDQENEDEWLIEGPRRLYTYLTYVLGNNAEKAS
jgi:hypothetical protein